STATHVIYTLSLHDALPISRLVIFVPPVLPPSVDLSPSSVMEFFGSPVLPSYFTARSSRSETFCSTSRSWLTLTASVGSVPAARSEEHTSELQSRENLVCRL